jgi:GDP-L-fucose synthase
MNKDSKIFVAGHRGLVGSAIIRQLKEQGYTNILTKSRVDLDLRNQESVNTFFLEERPDYVFLAAAKVGGIGFNKECPADFIRDNLQIQTNVIDAAYNNGCSKLLFLGSACIYPKMAPVPIKEEYLMTGPLEPTNDGYALAKIAGYQMCKKYTEQYGFSTVSVMPNNLYGINDNFIPSQCHVIPSFINRFIQAAEEKAREVVCFGDGTPTREFLFSDDLADGLIFLMNNYDNPEVINIGPNREVSIKDLSELVAKEVGYTGEIVWDTTKPNGTPRRALDTSKMDSLGWKAKTSLEDGLKLTVKWFFENRSNYVRV